MTILEVHEALSGITGSISLAAWILVLAPQLWENYKLSSADGVSLTFLFVWFVGDLTNLVGAIWAQLVPTVIAIAVYFCFANVILIAQCLYYNYLYTRKDQKTSASEQTAALDDAHQPLLRRRTNSNDNIGLPGSRRRSSAAYTRYDGMPSPGLPTIIEEPGDLKVWLINASVMLAICAAGTLGWLAAWKSGIWQPSYGDSTDDAPRAIGAEILGYISAVAYLGARIPQIMKNYKEKSCEGTLEKSYKAKANYPGLSLLFFMLSMLGNLTYGASILLHSIERRYVLKNLPWLVGSLGTIVEDVTIFVQFRLYSKQKDDSALAD